MFSKEFISDIKTLFDAIRNIAICASLTLGLPFIEIATPTVFGHNWLKFIATSLTIGIILGLYIFNLVWLFSSFSERPKSKLLHGTSSFILVTLVSATIAGTAFKQVWGLLFQYS